MSAANADARVTPVGPGVFVLGMHRSGTSVVTGLLDRLGLDGGPRSSMLSADKFNSDGYWEQRPVVEWHDRVLGRLRGWASAPPALDGASVRGLADELRPEVDALLGGLYDGPWFLKDPRQCLLLAPWNEVRGDQDLAVAVFRDPAGVIGSLGRRNGYSVGLSAALWERYCHDMIEGLVGRRCVVVRYEDLVAEPERWTSTIAETVAGALPSVGTLDVARIGHAAELVRTPSLAATPPPRAEPDLQTEQRALLDVLSTLTGVHESLAAADLPPLSQAGCRLVERRRRRLNAIRPLVRSSSSVRAFFDRLPAIGRAS